MNIEKIKNDDELTVKIIGRLDTTTAPVLEDDLKNDLSDLKKLILDLEDLNYISSAGLRVILRTEKIMSKQGTMIIKNVNELIMEIFNSTGFSDVLKIE